MSLNSQILRLVVYEGSGANSLTSEERFSTISALLDRGYSVTRAGGERPVAPDDGAPIAIVGRAQDGQFSEMLGVRFESLDDATPLVDRLTKVSSDFAAAVPGAWKPWFPVIDYDRCTNCMQCLSFCLFGVYGVDTEKQIQVQNQDNCKTNCPACSRVCPEAAIMFPKYKAGPINGDMVSDSDLNREKMKIDISALLGGDVYSMLRTRSERAQSRFSKERDSDKALVERQKCLTKLASLAADVPPEVLMSLPSPDEIARKAKEAAARVQAATGTSTS